MNIDISDPECDVKWCWEKFRKFFNHTPILINYGDVQKWAGYEAQESNQDVVRRLIDAWVSLEYMEKIDSGWWRAR
jgi:hypothetical protein